MLQIDTPASSGQVRQEHTAALPRGLLGRRVRIATGVRMLLVELERDDGEAGPALSIAVARAERLLDQLLEVLAAEVGAVSKGADVDGASVVEFCDRVSHGRDGS